MLDNESIPSSRVAIIAVPPEQGVQSFLLGIVEDFSASNRYASENLKSLGKFAPPENITNNVEASVRWGMVHKLNDENMRAIYPQVARYATFRGFDIVAMDPIDKRIILRVVGVKPEMLDVTNTNNRAMRQNYSGIALFVQHGAEALQSSQAAA